MLCTPLNGGGNGLESGTGTGTPVTFLPFRERITNSYRQVFGTVAPWKAVVVQTNGQASMGVEAVAAVVDRRWGRREMGKSRAGEWDRMEIVRGGDTASGGIKAEWTEAHGHQAYQRSELGGAAS